MNERGSTTVVAVMILALVVAPAAGALASGIANMTGPDAINEQADAAHNPYIEADVTKASHQLGWEATRYEDDSGEETLLPADVNDSKTNVVEFTASDINESSFGEFPRKSEETGNNDASALDASEWSKDETSTAQTGSVSDVTTASGVDAVEVSISSQTGGDTFIATYSNFSVTSDVDKRYLQLVGDVDTLDSGALVRITANDTDGDYVNASLDTDDNYDSGQTFTNQTGEGFVFQQQIGNMPVSGNGDGDMGEVQEISIIIDDADADVELSAINVEKQGAWDFGEREADWDDDGNNETESVQQWNQTSTLGLTDIDTMGATFDDAEVRDVTYPMHFEQSEQSEADDYERWNVSYESADNYPSFEWRIDDYRRLHLPSAYDLSYANTELRDEVAVPNSRYITAEYGTSVGETNFTDISYTDASSSYDPVDEDIQLTTGIGAGDEVAVHYEYTLTEDQKAAVQDTESGGAAPIEEDDEGFFGGIWGWIAGGIGGLGLFKWFQRDGGS